MKNPTINSPVLWIMQRYENARPIVCGAEHEPAPFAPVKQSERKWLVRMRDEARRLVWGRKGA